MHSIPMYFNANSPQEFSYLTRFYWGDFEWHWVDGSDNDEREVGDEYLRWFEEEEREETALRRFEMPIQTYKEVNYYGFFAY